MLKADSKIPILVTAVGSELSFSILKAIKCSQFDHYLVGCDIYEEVVGKYWCDRFENVPLAKNKDAYLQRIIEIVKAYNVRILIPTVDPESVILSPLIEEFKERYGCHILVNRHEELERYNDKWRAYEWYGSHDIPTPETVLCTTVRDLHDPNSSWTFPCIIKPRTGGGSRHVHMCHSVHDLERYLPVVPEPIIQDFVGQSEEEYTAGTYRTMGGEVYVILLKRTLKFGMTNTAETVTSKELEAFCRDVILKTNLLGSNNIQFRIAESGPKVIEINPRFSGTVGIRAKFGFNDVEMWITEALDLGVLNPPKLTKGRVLRFMDELYLE